MYRRPHDPHERIITFLVLAKCGLPKLVPVIGISSNALRSEAGGSDRLVYPNDLVECTESVGSESDGSA
jgi:hypothetical protein